MYLSIGIAVFLFGVVWGWYFNCLQPPEGPDEPDGWIAGTLLLAALWGAFWPLTVTCFVVAGCYKLGRLLFCRHNHLLASGGNTMADTTHTDEDFADTFKWSTTAAERNWLMTLAQQRATDPAEEEDEFDDWPRVRE